MENFTLLALTSALTDLAAGSVIRRIQPSSQPDAHAVTLVLESGRRRWLHISPGPIFPCLLMTNEPPYQAVGSGTGGTFPPSSFVMLLRKYLKGAVILAIDKPPLERIISFHCRNRLPAGLTSRSTLVVELAGRHANLILLDGAGHVLGNLRKTEGRIIPGLPYDPPPAPPGGKRIDPFLTGPGSAVRVHLEKLLIDAILRFPLDEDHPLLVKELLRGLGGFGPIYAGELAASLRMAQGETPGHSSDRCVVETWDRFRTSLEQLAEPGTHPGFLFRQLKATSGDQQTVLSAMPLPCSRPASHWSCRTFECTALAAAALRKEFLGQRDEDRLRAGLSASLNKACRKNERLRNRLEDEMQRFEGAETYRRHGELLTASLNSREVSKKKRGLAAIMVPDYYHPDGVEIEIELDPKLTLSQNAQSYFRRYRRSLRGQSSVSERLAEARLRGAHLDQLLTAVQLSEGLAELESVGEEVEGAGVRLRKQTAIHRSAKTRATPIPGIRRFRSDDGMIILVGRSARGNDSLIRDHANPEDFWLHAAGMAGSHVVVRNETGLERLPARTLEQAAGLAAHYSRGRNSSKVDVHLTKRKHVRKPKGAPPGLVTLKDFSTVLSKPSLGAKPVDPGAG